MKICSKCQKIYPDVEEICPDCGTELILEEPAPEKPKKNMPLLIGIIVAVLAVLAIGAVILFSGKEEPAASAVSTVEGGHHINAHGYTSHSITYVTSSEGDVRYFYMDENGSSVDVSEADVVAMMDAEIARSGDHVLNGRNLMYYYEQQYYNFYNQYGSYLSYMMDTTKGLDEQLSSFGADTWQQYFLNSAVNFFLQTSAMYDKAVAAGHQLSEAEQTTIADLETDLTYVGLQYGFQSADEYLKSFYGPYATLKSYQEYITICTTADSYALAQTSTIEITDAEVEAYYDENAESLQSSYRLQKVDQHMVNVRHILIQPASTGQGDPTEEAWAAAEVTANGVYDLWMSEPTEEHFAELAAAYTQDPGSQSTGGLYEGVYPGQMLPEFNDWCFAEGRKPGDHGMVKTSYGYHLMYFVEETDEIYWRKAVKSLLQNQKVADLWASVMDENAVINKDKAVILTTTMPTVPAATETAAK